MGLSAEIFRPILSLPPVTPTAFLWALALSVRALTIGYATVHSPQLCPTRLKSICCLQVLVWYLLGPRLDALRNVPGPFGWPVVGNLLPFVDKGANVYFEELSKQYGRIFKVTHQQPEHLLYRTTQSK